MFTIVITSPAGAVPRTCDERTVSTMRTRIRKLLAVLAPALVLAFGLADQTLWP
jgi:hypothetical protein